MESALEIISARAAFDSGCKRYFTGQPCKHGHIAERMISNGSCVACLKIRRASARKQNYERVKAWRLANPGARAEEARRYRLKHPETGKKASAKYRAANLEKIRKADAATHRRLRAINPEGERLRQRRMWERREKRLTDAAGRPRPDQCDLCSETDDRIVFDHCHASGAFRGWLCDRCNRTLGQVRDSPALLMKMIKYLERHHNDKVDCQETQRAA